MSGSADHGRPGTATGDRDHDADLLWLVDIRRLRSEHRGRRQITGTAAVPDLRLETAEVPGDSVGYELDIDATGSDVTVTGRIDVVWRADCRRCLDPIERSETMRLQEVFQVVEIEGETWPIVDDRIDLGLVVREHVLLALPLAPVCRDDCGGPDPDDDHGLLQPGSDGPVAMSDPRWAALEQLHFD